MLISCNRHGRCWLSSLFPRWLVRSYRSRLSLDRSVHDRPSPEKPGCSSFKLVVAKICCICSITCIHLASNYQKPPSTRTTHASPTCFIPPTHYSWSSVVIILHVARIRLIVNCYSTLQYSVLLQTLFAIKQSIRYFYYFARLCELWFFLGTFTVPISH